MLELPHAQDHSHRLAWCRLLRGQRARGRSRIERQGAGAPGDGCVLQGRGVAPEKPTLQRENEPPGPEDLTPEEIQALIDADPAAFRRLAQGLTDAATIALQAADEKNVEKLFASGDEIDKACENCHVKYWYPKDRKPAVDALSRRKR